MLARRAAQARRSSTARPRPAKASHRPLGQLCGALAFLGLLLVVLSSAQGHTGLGSSWLRLQPRHPASRGLLGPGRLSLQPGLLRHGSLRRMQHAKDAPGSRVEADALVKSALVADATALDDWMTGDSSLTQLQLCLTTGD